MIFRKKTAAVCAAVCIFILPAALGAAEQASLFADTINYNTNTKEVKASGNVALTRGRSQIRGQSGEGSLDSRVFEIKGAVSGLFPEYNAELKSAEALKWTGGEGDGVVEARGGVWLTRGANDYLRANHVTWEVGGNNYSARGGVNMRYEGRILRAAEARRSGESFEALKVTRYEDTTQNMVMSADRVDGKISGDTVREVVARGNVSVDYLDDDGFKTNLTGDKAEYSRDRDTVVVSGGAKAVRSDGRTLSSQTMILYVGPKRLEAVGGARITFPVEKAGSGGDKKSGAAK